MFTLSPPKTFESGIADTIRQIQMTEKYHVLKKK